MSKHGQTLEKIRDLPDSELVESLVTTRDELFRMQLGQYTNQVTSSAGIQTKRRDIARILTVLSGRKLGFEKQAQKAAAEAVAAEPVKKTKKAKKS
ncbi:MAG TPA: 50S ribosomal protein L29 [Kofleriaceae bacterium]